MDYRKHLEEKFRKYQAILGDCAEDDEKIDLEEITKDFCEIDEWGRISIRRIPAKGSNVYFTILTEESKENSTDIIIPISQVSDNALQFTVENMRKAMIIEELRNTYTHE